MKKLDDKKKIAELKAYIDDGQVRKKAIVDRIIARLKARGEWAEAKTGQDKLELVNEAISASDEFAAVVSGIHEAWAEMYRLMKTPGKPPLSNADRLAMMPKEYRPFALRPVHTLKPCVMCVD